MTASNGVKPTFGVIGYGRFGKFWTNRLLKLGKVWVYEPRPLKEKPNSQLDARDINTLLAKVDVLFLAMPISQVEDICKQIKTKLEPETIVADVCSVKVYPAKVMRQILPKNQPLIGTHPLFGPDSAGRAKTLKGFKIVVCPLRASKPKLQSFTKILKKLQAELIFTTPENHDLQMARSQALIHYIGRGIQSLNLRPQKIATLDYSSLLHIKDVVVHDSWRLFFDMQNFNPYIKDIRSRLTDNLRAIELKIQNSSQDIKNLRQAIGYIDRQIINLVASRSRLSENIGRLKRKAGQKISDPQREKKLTAFHDHISRKLDLDAKMVNKIFQILISNSKRLQHGKERK